MERWKYNVVSSSYSVADVQLLSYGLFTGKLLVQVNGGVHLRSRVSSVESRVAGVCV